MLHLNDSASMRHAPLDPTLRSIIDLRLSQLSSNFEGALESIVEFVIVEPGDSAAKVARVLGFSPLSNVVSGATFGQPDFEPSTEWIGCHGAWFELVYILTDDGFGTIVFVPNDPGTEFDLHSMCIEFSCG